MIRHTKKGWSDYATELAANITLQECILYGTPLGPRAVGDRELPARS